MKNFKTMTMNKTLLIICGLALGAFLQSCGTDDSPAVTPTKTVNKSLLYDKDWNRDGSTWHVFESDGTWNNDGTWKWLNNSDSMEVMDQFGTSILYFDYIEAKEMKCGSSLPGVVYTSP